jgi:hypothetical protein
MNKRFFVIILMDCVIGVVHAERMLGPTIKAVDALPSSYVTSPTAWFSVDEDKTLSWHNVSEDNSETNIVWQSTALPKGTPDAAATNAIWKAIASNKLLAESGIRNWGNYAPDGTDNPEPDYMLFVNKPAMVIGSGIHFETSGSYSVMVTDGAVAFANNGQDGSVRWGLGGESYIAIVQGGSVLVGAKANSINMDVENEICTIEYPYSGGDYPMLYFAPTLANEFTVVESPVWVDLGNGFAQVSVSTANTDSGFFKAMTSVQLSARFEPNVPTKLAKGLITDDPVSPIIFDSTIIIEQGGKKYRVPAQLVEE